MTDPQMGWMDERTELIRLVHKNSTSSSCNCGR